MLPRFEIEEPICDDDRGMKTKVSPGIPPGCKSVHCDIEGRRPFPNPQRFCTCGYEHAPVRQRVKKVNNLDRILFIVQERISRKAISRVETGSLYTELRNKTFFLSLSGIKSEQTFPYFSQMRYLKIVSASQTPDIKMSDFILLQSSASIFTRLSVKNVTTSNSVSL